MWGRRGTIVEMVNSGENSAYLPGVELSSRITATTDLKSAVTGASAVVLAVPVGVTGEVVEAAVAHAPEAPFVSLSKGIEPGTLRTVSQLIATAGNLPPSQIVAISGPNLSMEIAMRQPTAAVVASEDVETAKQIARACHNEYFRPYVSTDLTGVEVAGATMEHGLLHVDLRRHVPETVVQTIRIGRKDAAPPGAGLKEGVKK